MKPLFDCIGWCALYPTVELKTCCVSGFLINRKYLTGLGQLGNVYRTLLGILTQPEAPELQG